MTPDRQRSPVTIEDLLRLKRAERPSAEFWSKFESELRQKQLAALLEKRPWWHHIAPLLARRVYLPAGAAAALALSLVSVRFYSSHPVAEIAPVDAATVADGTARAAGSASREADAQPVEILPTTIVAAIATAADRAGQESPTATPIAATLPGDVAELLPWSAPRQDESPSARSIAANLARLEQTEPELLEGVLNGRLAVAVRTQSEPSAPLAVEMAAVTTGSSRRTNRLLASYNDRHYAPEPVLSDIVRERAARRLADPDLFDQIRRLDLKGSSVSLKL